MYEIAREMNFDGKASRNKSFRDRSLIRLLTPPGVLICVVSRNKIFII